ncbi:MAG: isoprenylcysteine carboxylmethyltransferase family protein [Ruminococcus sp.]|nr:isoprenylcysteine carboxylmethyltransferase family protein [Ruminococcus sp.]
MIYRIIALSLLIAFYTFYIIKLLILNRKSIQTNKAGKGNKPKKVLVTERIMSIAAVSALIAQIISIFSADLCSSATLKCIGLIAGIGSVFFFGSAVVSMKDSWRVGIPEEKTELITDGIYKLSRNPAFVGFDLTYICTLLVFPNIPLLILSVWSAVMLHMQIIQEEVHMLSMFGNEYEHYKIHTARYFGRHK